MVHHLKPIGVYGCAAHNLDNLITISKDLHDSYHRWFETELEDMCLSHFLKFVIKLTKHNKDSEIRELYSETTLALSELNNTLGFHLKQLDLTPSLNDELIVKMKKIGVEFDD